MKYSPSRHFQYPVLRPAADDWSTLPATSLSIDDGTIKLDFTVEEQTIRSLIDANQARCAAMLFCSSTLYSVMKLAPERSMTLEIDIPKESVANELEVWPSVITTTDVILSTVDAHSEYQQQPIDVGMLKPLVLDERWRIPLGATPARTETLFKLQSEDGQPEGLFSLDANQDRPYITLIMGPETKRQFDLLRRGKTPWALASVYVSALAEVLRRIDVDASTVDDNGWQASILAKLRELGLEPEQAIDNAWDTAQRILQHPYGSVLAETENELTEDESE